MISTSFELDSVLSYLKNLTRKPEQITYLVGAGISMDAPALLPSARQLCRDLFDFLGPYYNFAELANVEQLRYEMVIEKVQKYFDPELTFLNYLDFADLPNLSHIFLADCILKGCNVITTNFDYLIEWGLKLLLRGQNYEKVKIIISEDDYINLNTSPTSKNDDYYLYKIHGSIRNAFTDEITKASIITTVSSLGQNKNKEDIFGLESYKEEIVTKLLKKHTLIVMGYSGGDDFDITPVMKSISDYDKIIWFDHSQDNETIVESITSSTDPNKYPLLSEINKVHGIDITIIRTDTGKIVEEYLLDIFQPDTKNRIIEIWKQQLMIREGINKPTFSEWINKAWNVPYPSLSMKFGASLYYEAGIYDKALNMCKSGNQYLKKDINNPNLNAQEREFLEGLQHWFFIQLGTICIKDGLYWDAIQYLGNARLNAEKQNQRQNFAEASNILGKAMIKDQNYDNAKIHILAALEVSQELGDLKISTEVYFNLGILFTKSNDLTAASDELMKALETTNNTGDLEFKSRILTKLALLNLSKDNHTQAEEYIDKGVAITQSLGLLPLLYESKKALLTINEKTGRTFDKNILTSQVEKLYHKIGGFENEALKLYNISQSEFKNGQFDKGLEHLESLFLQSKQADDQKWNLKLSKEIGFIFRNYQKLEQAEPYFKELLIFALDLDEKETQLEANHQLSFITRKLQKLEEAWEYGKIALSLAENLENDFTRIECLEGMAAISFERKNDDLAKDFQLQALDLAKKINAPQRIAMAKSKYEYYLRTPSNRF